MSSEEKDFDLIILFTEPLIVKDAADEEFIGFFEGIASTPDVDLQGERFAPDVLMANAEKLKGKPRISKRELKDLRFYYQRHFLHHLSESQKEN